MLPRNWLTWVRRPFLSHKSARRRPHPTLLAAVQVCVLEDRRLLSGGTINVGNVAYQLNAVVNDPSQVLFTGGTAKGQDWGTVPQKQITFTNNSTDKQTIYPFLYSPNVEQKYDPIDPNNEEYRLYVGYTQGNQNYLGLPYKHSITITVPLVFWNGARADIATDGTNLLPQKA